LAVHCHLAGANLFAKPLARVCRVPLLVEHEHSHDGGRLQLPLVRAALHWARQGRQETVVMSHALATAIATERGGDPAHLHVIPNAVDTARFAKGNAERDALRSTWQVFPDIPIVGALGRFAPEKGFAHLLRAIPSVGGAQFIIAGAGPLEGSLRGLAAAHCIDDRVRFVGLVRDPARLYPALDLLVIPSLVEGVPLVLLEAMAAGVPVVASDLPGIREALGRPVAGRLVPAGDEAALAAGIRRALEDRGESKRLAAIAQSRAILEYDSASVAARLADVYRRALAADSA
jgi:glycosyltransferase involved in cell wall biosynthesis